jgi:hypothetical protein
MLPMSSVGIGTAEESVRPCRSPQLLTSLTTILCQDPARYKSDDVIYPSEIANLPRIRARRRIRPIPIGASRRRKTARFSKFRQ